MISMISVLLLSFSGNVKSQPRTSVDFQFFYDHLSPYGNWMSNPRYGYVWHPNVVSDFHPYRTNGHWVWTLEFEWMWVSDYEWGWAPFHYGRWYFDDVYGWLWIPSNEWSPAWVVWRNGIDFYGWAPLGPGMGISLLFSFGQADYFPEYYWSFVPQHYITAYNIHQHCYHPQRNHEFYKQSNYMSRRESHDEKERWLYVNGPSKSEVELRTREKIKPFNVLESDEPVIYTEQKEHIQIYKPFVELKGKEMAKPTVIDPYEKQTKIEKPFNEKPKNEIINEAMPKKDLKASEPLKDRINEKEINKQLITPKRNPEKEIPQQWEQYQKVPERPSVTPTINKPIQVTKPQNNQLKKLPNKKEELKRLPY